MIGPKYLFTLLQTVHLNLNESHLLHVRGFVYHSILESISPIITPPKKNESDIRIDFTDEEKQNQEYLINCLSLFLDVINNDIFGDIGKEKEDEFRYKVGIKELNSTKSYEIVEKLSSIIPFLPNQASIYILLL